MSKTAKLRVDAFLLLALIPLLDFLIGIGPPEPRGVPLLTSLIVVAILAFFHGYQLRKYVPFILLIILACAIGYTVMSFEFVGDLVHENGKKERVVTGYSLRPELESAIHEAITAAKAEDEIREQAIDAVVTQTGNAAAPYTRISRVVVTLTLFALWEMMLAGLAVFALIIRDTR